MKSNSKKLLKNIGLLTISNFGSKIMIFLLVPLYTRMLSTSDYGIYDMYITTISLLTPILTLNITDAVMRFLMDNENDKKHVLTIGFKITILSIICCSLIVSFNHYFHIISIFSRYSIFFILYYTVNILYILVTQYTKGIEQVKHFAIAGFLNSFFMLALNVIFLVVLKFGLEGYFIANILSLAIPTLYLVIKLKIFKEISFKAKNVEMKKAMLKYSIPIVFNTIGWWITNVSDRYIITYLIGVSATGIYSVAYKLPSILNSIQTIFSQAWNISVVKAYRDKDFDFINNIYNIYNTVLVFICSFLTILVRILAKILFANEFYFAWKYAPFLMLSVVFGSLSGFLGGIFSANKNSKIFGVSTIIGAIINIILNVLLINIIDVYGAAIATLISYVVVWIIRLVTVTKLIEFKFKKKSILLYIILLLQAIIINLKTNLLVIYAINLLLFFILIILNFSDLKKAFLKLYCTFTQKRKKSLQ